MASDESFLRAIIDDPEDDAVRLVYSDWLEEQGDPARVARAELIRLQIQEARRAREGLDADPKLEGRSRVLEQTFWRDWLGPLAEAFITAHLAVAPKPCLWFRRGFPEELTTNMDPQGVAVFLRWADELARTCPLRRLHFDCTRAGMAVNGQGIPDAPGPLDLATVQALAALPLLRRVRTLALIHCLLDDVGIEALASSPNLAGLTEIGLRGDRLTPHDVRALLAPGRLPNLTTLDLGGYDDITLRGGYFDADPRYTHRVGIDADGVRALAASPLPPRLRVLRLAHNDLREAALLPLAASPHLEQLTTLDVSMNYPDPETAAILRQRFGSRVTV
jgi:uncharacterized protein (TIGR02996 family)